MKVLARSGAATGVTVTVTEAVAFFASITKLPLLLSETATASGSLEVTSKVESEPLERVRLVS